MSQPTHTRSSVEKRYADAAKAPEAALCCPVEYDRKYLEVIPDEVIEKDYGCGDPSKWVKSGETVLDLGSGTGKICFIASQVVGAKGKVIGVDMTDDMLEVANRNAPIIAERIGYGNVEFRKGRIQDLALDLDLLGKELEVHPVASATDFLKLDEIAEALRIKQPLVETDSIDVVVSNCVLNLVEPEQKPKLFREIFRVLRQGGRAVISDIVSDEPVPEAMREDAHLWSGCISGALTEQGFLEAFEEAGFYGIELVKFETQPWQTVEGIEFRSVTVQAFKGKQGRVLSTIRRWSIKGHSSRCWMMTGIASIAACVRLFAIRPLIYYKAGRMQGIFLRLNLWKRWMQRRRSRLIARRARGATRKRRRGRIMMRRPKRRTALKAVSAAEGNATRAP